jgi:hypothetical protein
VRVEFRKPRKLLVERYKLIATIIALWQHLEEPRYRIQRIIVFNDFEHPNLVPGAKLCFCFTQWCDKSTQKGMGVETCGDGNSKQVGFSLPDQMFRETKHIVRGPRRVHCCRYLIASSRTYALKHGLGKANTKRDVYNEMEPLG